MKNADQNEKVIFISSHPDDHIFIGGTINKLMARGYDYYEVLLSGGGRGRVIGSDSTNILEIRSSEYNRAVEILDTTKVFKLNLPDGAINENYSINQVERIVKIIRKIKPDITLMMNSRDSHEDHRASYKISAEAVKRAGWGGLNDLGPRHKVGLTLMTDTLHGNANPHVLVNIDNFIKEKNELIESYDSQINSPFKSMIEAVNRIRGFTCRCEYAECFEIDPTFPISNEGLKLLKDLQ